MGKGNAIISIIDETGFVAPELARVLVAQEAASEITIYTSGTLPVTHEQVRVRPIQVPVGISEYATALRASTHIYHIEGYTHQVAAANQISTNTTQSIIQAVRGGALQQYILVHSSGSDVVGEPELKQSGLPYSIFHTGLIYGRNLPARSYLSSWVRLMQARSLWLSVSLDIPVPLIHVEDLAQALTHVLTLVPFNQEYNASTELTTVGAVFATLYEHSVGHAPSQFTLPGLSRLFRKQFPAIPTPSDRSADFRATFFPAQSPRSFAQRAVDCIGSHIDVRGYWVVTGANSGIGYELACRLHAAGKHMLMVDKDTSNLSGFGQQRIIRTDLSDVAQVRELIEKVSAYEIVALVNNAGIGFKGHFSEQSADAMLSTVHVNVTAPVLVTQALLPRLIQNDGVVVNIASSAAHNPLPGMAIYAASKSFVLQWSTALWYELRGKCRVVTISPSGTNTNFQKNAGVRNTTQLLTAEAVAKRVYHAVQTGKSFVFIGFKNQLVAYLTKMLPARLAAAFWGKLFNSMR